MNRTQRQAFTLVEMLVVIAIIGILLSLILPAVQAARETSRRGACMFHLAQIGQALQQYAAAHEVLPSGSVAAQGPVHSTASGYHHNWLAAILPYLDQPSLYNHLDRSLGVYDAKNASVRSHYLAILACPTDMRSRQAAGSNYAACHHDVEAPIDETNTGAFVLNRGITWEEITDGGSQTILVGEKLVLPNDLGWISGTRATLRNTGTTINASTVPGGLLARIGEVRDGSPRPLPEGGPTPREAEKSKQAAAGAGGSAPPNPALVVGGFESLHPGGALFLFGDGSVHFILSTIQPAVYTLLGHRADGQLISDADY